MSERGTRVLVVDDAPEIRLVIEEIIKCKDAGWQVVGEARDGREGIDKARSEQPDLVLLDISMPVMDGLEALPLMREAAPRAIVVVLSGFPSSAGRDSALQAGAQGYIEKDELIASLVPQLEDIRARMRPPAEPEKTAAATG